MVSGSRLPGGLLICIKHDAESLVKVAKGVHSNPSSKPLARPPSFPNPGHAQGFVSSPVPQVFDIKPRAFSGLQAAGKC